jgi:Fungal protein kinase
MSIEALLAINRTFVHQPRHDLESILYIILYICTLVRGPSLPLDVTHFMSAPICTWFCNDSIREIGYRKLAHLECYDLAILPHFTPYWCDFTPFVKDLIITCFPVRPRLPNNFQYDQALRILKTAYNSVGEPASPSCTPVPGVFCAQCLTWTRRQASNSLDRDAKKGRSL